jgi:hypothetical protein
MTTSTGDKLRAAAQRVRSGWTRWVFREEDGRVCAAGALGLTYGPGVCQQVYAHAEELHALARALGFYRPVGNAIGALLVIQHWNDTKGQTAANVAMTLELAALIADEEAAGKQRAVQAAENVWWTT